MNIVGHFMNIFQCNHDKIRKLFFFVTEFYWALLPDQFIIIYLLLHFKISKSFNLFYCILCMGHFQTFQYLLLFLILKLNYYYVSINLDSIVKIETYDIYLGPLERLVLQCFVILFPHLQPTVPTMKNINKNYTICYSLENITSFIDSSLLTFLYFLNSSLIFNLPASNARLSPLKTLFLALCNDLKTCNTCSTKRNSVKFG